MLQIQNLCFSYSGRPPYLLDHINLKIERGAYVSILGENGCGKTTLMRLLLQFLKPSAGQISLDAKRIGYVPQRSDAASGGFPITVWEMLNSYRHLLKMKEKSAADTALQQVGLQASRHALVGTLSGGQMQKALIARALIGNPDLLILDEPSTGVDVGSQKEIYGLLRQLNREQQITILSVEHNLPAAIKNSTLIYHLHNGKGHLCSPQQYAEEFLQNNALEDVSHAAI